MLTGVFLLFTVVVGVFPLSFPSSYDCLARANMPMNTTASFFDWVFLSAGSVTADQSVVVGVVSGEGVSSFLPLCNQKTASRIYSLAP